MCMQPFSIRIDDQRCEILHVSGFVVCTHTDFIKRVEGNGVDGACRLESQPTNLRQNTCYFEDRTLGQGCLERPSCVGEAAASTATVTVWPILRGIGGFPVIRIRTGNL